MQVPEKMSQTRAAAISGLSREAIARAIPSNGGYYQVPTADLERLMGKPVTLDMWEDATLALGRKAMARSAA